MMVSSIESVGVLSINLDAIADNWQLLQQRVQSSRPDAYCAAVVKADAYGLGVAPVANVLSQAGCHTFYVATLAEGVELRQGLQAEADIIVLGGLCHGVDSAWYEYQLIPVLLDKSHIDLWVNYCQYRDEELPSVIKVDTGMHRLGLSYSEFKTLCEQPLNLNVISVMTHLACADQPQHPINRQQYDLFSEIVNQSRLVFPNALFSMANSSGVFLGDAFLFDVARPGAALYGVNPTPAESNPMQSVVTLKLPIMQVKALAKGEFAGYGAGFEAERDSTIAIVFGGYADGLLRCMSHVGYVFVGSHKVSISGRISMDSIIIDVTDVPESELAKGVVEVIGPLQSVDDVAQYANTIGYEVLTSLGSRYKRRYLSTKYQVVSS